MSRNIAVTTSQAPRMIVHELPLAKTVHLGYLPININRCMGQVTLLHSSHFQALRSFITILHSHDTQFPTNNSISQQYPSYGPPWQGYDLHQGGHGESRMFPQQQFPGQGPSSPGAPRVPPGLPGNNPVNWPTSSSSTPPPGPPSGTPGRPPISLATKRFPLPAEPRETDVARSADMPPLPEIAYDEYDSDE